jgi:hypothetical protein
MAPYVRSYFQRIPAAAADDATAAQAILRAPHDGTVTEVTFVPDADLTGADTNSATLGVVNKGLDGNGTTVVASKAFTNTVNALDFDETTITLTATTADRAVLAGQVLAWQRTKVGTGLATPAGVVKVSIQAT